MRGLLLLVGLLLFGVFPLQAGLSKLEAISMLESGNNDRAIGGAGEVSRYQIMPRVWRAYTSARTYDNVELSTLVAYRHLAYLERVYRNATGREPSDFDRYVLWNAGPTYYARVRFSSARVHSVIRERALRFVNLCQMSDEQVQALRRNHPPVPILMQPTQGMLAIGVLP